VEGRVSGRVVGRSEARPPGPDPHGVAGRIGAPPPIGRTRRPGFAIIRGGLCQSGRRRSEAGRPRPARSRTEVNETCTTGSARCRGSGRGSIRAEDSPPRRPPGHPGPAARARAGPGPIRRTKPTLALRSRSCGSVRPGARRRDPDRARDPGSGPLGADARVRSARGSGVGRRRGLGAVGAPAGRSRAVRWPSPRPFSARRCTGPHHPCTPGFARRRAPGSARRGVSGRLGGSARRPAPHPGARTDPPPEISLRALSALCLPALKKKAESGRQRAEGRETSGFAGSGNDALRSTRATLHGRGRWRRGGRDSRYGRPPVRSARARRAGAGRRSYRSGAGGGSASPGASWR